MYWNTYILVLLLWYVRPFYEANIEIVNMKTDGKLVIITVVSILKYFSSTQVILPHTGQLF